MRAKAEESSINKYEEEDLSRSECSIIFERIWKNIHNPIEIEKRKIERTRQENIDYNREDLGL